MSRNVVEEAIVGTDPDGDPLEVAVTVRREGGHVHVTVGKDWSREFTPPGLEAVMHYIEELGERLWLQLRDRNRTNFYAHLEDDQLALAANWPEAQVLVPWDATKDALNEALHHQAARAGANSGG